MGETRYGKSNFDLEQLAEVSKGYSGAEIEEAINEGLYHAYNDDRELEIDDLVNAIKKTYPLSKVMADKITKLREWARVRARFASKDEAEGIDVDKDEAPKLKQEVDNPFI